GRDRAQLFFGEQGNLRPDLGVVEAVGVDMVEPAFAERRAPGALEREALALALDAGDLGSGRRPAPVHGSPRLLQLPPHTSRATVSTSSSLRRSSSRVTVCPLPPPEEKPHCGLRPSRSRSTWRAASSIRRLISSLLSNTGVFELTRPSTTDLLFRRWPS